jgi:transcriptional regulator with XRE-family HTH domain
MLNIEKIGQKIALLRGQMGIKQNELAEKLFVTHQAVSKWENGKSIPSIEILYELTKFFNVSIDYLLDNSDIKPDDYQTLLRIHPRESVIRKFMFGLNPELNFDKIFYLLNKKERMILLEQIRLGKVGIHLEDFWHLLSKNERYLVLSGYKNKSWDLDMSLLFNQLSIDERRLVNKNFITIGGKKHE